MFNIREETYDGHSLGFHKHTTLAIMPILRSEALQNISMCYLGDLKTSIHAPLDFWTLMIQLESIVHYYIRDLKSQIYKLMSTYSRKKSVGLVMRGYEIFGFYSHWG